jgi:hypothetical protein
MFEISSLNQKNSEIFNFKDSFYNGISDNEFPIRKYIEKQYKTAGGYFYSDDEFTIDALLFLFKNAQLISYTSVGKLNLINQNPIDGIRGGSFWFSYKDIYIRISMKNQPDDNENIATTSLGTPPVVLDQTSDDEELQESGYNKNIEKIFSILCVAPVFVQKFPFEDFKPFILNKKRGRVHIFIRNPYGEYDFEPINLEINTNIDLQLNYGSEFLDINDTIIDRLNTKSNGLYMFHGSPGTGKTTYIKYLANTIDKDFIYIPTSMLEYFSTDPNSLSNLLRKPNSVLILEDAEKIILKREDGGNSSSVSSLLNLSDGIMSDIMKTSIILTYNCSKHDIDEALMRKGRLQIDYEFKNLNQENAKLLANSLNYPEDFIENEIKSDMSLADIYNLQTKVDFIDKKMKKNKVIGFGSC